MAPQFEVGDRVLGACRFGSYATRLNVPAQQVQIILSSRYSTAHVCRVNLPPQCAYLIAATPYFQCPMLCLQFCADKIDTNIKVLSVQLLKMPADWSFAQGAAFLVQSLTAYYGLKSLGNIQVHPTHLALLAATKNRLLLAHSACVLPPSGCCCRRLHACCHHLMPPAAHHWPCCFATPISHAVSCYSHACCLGSGARCMVSACFKTVA